MARRLLDGPETPLGRLAADHAVEAVAFARDSAPATVAALVEMLRTPSRPDDPAARHRLAAALSEALKSRPRRARVVLVTDGRRNAPGDPGPDRRPPCPRGASGLSRSRRLDPAAPRRRRGSGQGPRRGLQRDVATVEATIKLDGLAGQEVAVTLERPGMANRFDRRAGPAEAAGPLSRSGCRWKVGPDPLTVAVGPVAGDVRPITTGARSRSRWSTTRPASCSSMARRAGSSAMSATPWRATRALRSRPLCSTSPNRSAAQTEPTSQTALPPPIRHRPARSPGGFDPIIVGDVDPIDAFRPPSGCESSPLAERGTLVISPGPRFWPGFKGNPEIVRKLFRSATRCSPPPIHRAGFFFRSVSYC